MSDDQPDPTQPDAIQPDPIQPDPIQPAPTAEDREVADRVAWSTGLTDRSVSPEWYARLLEEIVRQRLALGPVRQDSYRAMIAVENAVLWNIHGPDECARHSCWIHRPSDHPLAQAPVWVLTGSEIYRACQHFELDTADRTGLHPDPDWMSYAQGATRYPGWQDRWEHPCCDDRCCHA